MSRSGPLMGFKSVTVWSAHGVLECHGLVRSSGFGSAKRSGLVRSWGLGVSRSGPLMASWNVTVWSADGVLERHGLVRSWGFGV